MNLWFVFALMTAAAMFAVLLPLGLGGTRPADGNKAQSNEAQSNEAMVYKDQLAEIERDVATGLIGSTEAEAARVEIGRRLLAVADQASGPPARSSPRLRRVAAILALVGLPLLALAIYLPLGSPLACGFPACRAHPQADAAQPLVNLVAQVEQHLEKESERRPRLERAGAGAASARPL